MNIDQRGFLKSKHKKNDIRKKTKKNGLIAKKSLLNFFSTNSVFNVTC
ncbi:conserved hypothetical protein [delta proteobacterium NaphS2]|nr:conserved hypothetical protein [delta proteobacterium NaphS2]